MKIVGIDLSLTATGIADGPTHTTHGTILATLRPTAAAKRDGRYGRHRWLAIRVLEWADGADLVALEDYAPNSIGRNATIAIAELGGIVRCTLEAHQIPYTLTRPNTLKLFATGKGNATKAEMVAAARKYGASPANDNEADAYWLRHYAQAQQRSPQP